MIGHYNPTNNLLGVLLVLNYQAPLPIDSCLIKDCLKEVSLIELLQKCVSAFNITYVKLNTLKVNGGKPSKYLLFVMLYQTKLTERLINDSGVIFSL